ncbi:MAG: heavy metal sensor histidine kinase [Gammaproteobacteria bacterium]|nr:heavy metal sensor histidine kinase [Gammaproteobacteria bacterium]
MMLRSRSITRRISLWLGGSTLVVLLAMGYLIVASVRNHFDEQDRVAVQGKLELIQNILAMEGQSSHESITLKLKDSLVGHHELVVLVAAGNTVIFRTEHAKFLARYLQNPEKYSALESLNLRSWQDDGRTYRGIVVFLPESPGEMTRFTVAIAVDAQQHIAFMDMFKLQLTLVGLAGLVLMGCLGWIVTHRGLMPVSNMARVAEGISAQRLDDRLQLDLLPSELHSLAVSFNDMLDRLEGSLHRLSDYASDIAHELRTPVNTLMTQTQVSLSQSRTADQYREILYSNLEEYERLARIISDMLFLAKADNGLMIPSRQLFNVRNEVDALFEFYDAVAAEKRVRLQTTGAAELQGDPLMIRRALSNLISNAIRHSDAGSAIEVNIAPESGAVRISITNEGDTITPSQLERVFDRFYRADASRSRGDDGAGLGLGLAITRSIIEAHHGRVSATSAHGRTCFVVVIPVNS